MASQARFSPVSQVVIAVLSVLCGQAFAEDLYRKGVPGVVAAPAPPEDAGDKAGRAFAADYARMGRPRLVLFWNRAYDGPADNAWRDETVTRRSGQHHDLVTRRDAGADPATGGRVGTESTAGGFDETTVTTIGKRREAAPARAGAGESIDWRIEEGFRAAIQGAGGRFIDPAAAGRQAAQEQASTTPDMQAIETKALSDRADYLIEVLMTPEPSLPGGWRFRIEVKGIRSAETVVAFTSEGRPRSSSQHRYVATRQGFEVVPDAISFNDVGKALAVETMERLAAVW